MLSARSLTKRFTHQHGGVTALSDVSFQAAPGEFLCITGPSGSGKSSLLLAAGGMSAPDQGEVLWDQSSVYGWNPAQRAQWRGHHVGFLFQTFNLVPYLTVRENIGLALTLSGEAGRGAGSIPAVIEKMNLGHRAGHLPGELSVGEQQRAALARALIKDPAMILADEPTGNLDPENAAQIISILKETSRQGRTVVVVTHDPRISAAADRTIRIVEGKIVS